MGQLGRLVLQEGFPPPHSHVPAGPWTEPALRPRARWGTRVRREGHRSALLSLVTRRVGCFQGAWKVVGGHFGNVQHLMSHQGPT